MPILTYNNETFECARAQKGSDFVRLLDENNNEIFFADGITDFSKFALADGTWESPHTTVTSTVGATATLNGNVLNLTVPGSTKIETDLQINFKAPCNCTAITCLSVGGKTYALKDARGKNAIGHGDLWVAGSPISVILDVENETAYLLKDCKSHVVRSSYVGSGTYGANNPCSLTFGFEPDVLLYLGRVQINTSTGEPVSYFEQGSGHADSSGAVKLRTILMCDLLTTEYEAGWFLGSTISPSTNFYAKKSEDGRTISWYSVYVGDQLNATNYKYYFAALKFD